jgi:hypothetical protein
MNIIIFGFGTQYDREIVDIDLRFYDYVRFHLKGTY